MKNAILFAIGMILSTLGAAHASDCKQAATQMTRIHEEFHAATQTYLNEYSAKYRLEADPDELGRVLAAAAAKNAVAFSAYGNQMLVLWENAQQKTAALKQAYPDCFE